jgi:hypothetical protein
MVDAWCGSGVRCACGKGSQAAVEQAVGQLRWMRQDAPVGRLVLPGVRQAQPEWPCVVGWHDWTGVLLAAGCSTWHDGHVGHEVQYLRHVRWAHGGLSLEEQCRLFMVQPCSLPWCAGLQAVGCPAGLAAAASPLAHAGRDPQGACAAFCC